MRLINRGGVAVVIPAYNAQEYIADCLDSILAQTYSNWTIYCVNDGSRDKTREILNQYAEKDQRIKVFHTENGGASSARNYALSQIANEEWISFLDADDYVAPTMYETIFKAIDNNETDYVRLFCQRTPLRYKSKKSESTEQSAIIKKVVSRDDYFLHESVGGYTHSCFVKADIVKENNLSFCKEMKILEDQAFSISCATHAKQIMVLDQPRNYFYYSGNESSLTRNSKDTSDDIIRCVNIVFKAFQATGSKAIINDYFYSKYLPIKLDSFCGKRLHYRHTKPIGHFLPAIKLSMKYLPLKAKVKYMLVKMLGLGK